MENLILKHAPNYWHKDAEEWNAEYRLHVNSNEFQQIQSEIWTAVGARYPIARIDRIQNLHDLGQTLVRGQLLSCINSENWYRVRRFVKLRNHYRNAALDYNLDPRRCGLNTLQLYKQISSDIYRSDIIFVVQVVTSEPYADIIMPDCSSEYFIDYVVTFN